MTDTWTDSMTRDRIGQLRYRESLLPCFDEAEWALWRGGGMPWWFVRREVLESLGLAEIRVDGTAKEVGGDG